MDNSTSFVSELGAVSVVLCTLLGTHTIQPLMEKLSKWCKHSSKLLNSQHSNPRQHYRNSSCSIRRTPLAEGGYSLNEILNGHQIRSKIDVLLPSQTHIAQGKQAKRATKSQLNEKHQQVEKVTQTFKTGSPLLCFVLWTTEG